MWNNDLERRAGRLRDASRKLYVAKRITPEQRAHLDDPDYRIPKFLPEGLNVVAAGGDHRGGRLNRGRGRNSRAGRAFPFGASLRPTICLPREESSG